MVPLVAFAHSHETVGRLGQRSSCGRTARVASSAGLDLSGARQPLSGDPETPP